MIIIKFWFVFNYYYDRALSNFKTINIFAIIILFLNKWFMLANLKNVWLNGRSLEITNFNIMQIIKMEGSYMMMI